MAADTITQPVELRIDARLYQRLHQHLFPGDHNEHGAIIAAGIAETARGIRLLARDLFLARDGVEYVAGTRGYRALTAPFVARISDYCAQERLCYLAVHNHGGTDTVGFSPDDLASHERGYPALLEITRGGPVGALVLAEHAIAGDVWFPHSRAVLSHATIIGQRIAARYPSPRARPTHVHPMYDRQTRLFGTLGQAILRELKVGIIGLGGGGSLINQWLAHLGVGHIVAIDFDKVDLTNRPRIVGSTRWDAMTLLTARRSPWLQRLGKRLARYKVTVAKRVARTTNPAITYDAIIGDVLDEPTAKLLTDADFLFLASDTIPSRLIFNALVQQYLIPGAQIGVKIKQLDGRVAPEQSFAATRLVLPGPGGGCLECHGLIPPARLQEAALAPAERRQQRYIDDPDVIAPSVITLNALSAAQAANDLMMLFTGLYEDKVALGHQMHFVCERNIVNVTGRHDEHCPDCGSQHHSRRARGDRERLPCRA